MVVLETSYKVMSILPCWAQVMSRQQLNCCFQKRKKKIEPSADLKSLGFRIPTCWSKIGFVDSAFRHVDLKLHHAFADDEPFSVATHVVLLATQVSAMRRMHARVCRSWRYPAFRFCGERCAVVHPHPPPRYQQHAIEAVRYGWCSTRSMLDHTSLLPSLVSVLLSA